MNEDRYRAAETALWESLDVTPTEREIPLRRLDSTIRIQEVGDGPTVLFVHGTTSSGANWAPLVARLRGFRGVLIDRPGCGLSPVLPMDLSDLSRFNAMADDLVVDVLDALDVEHGHVVATSLGGYLALRAAAAHPGRIGRLVEFGYLIGAPMQKIPRSMRLATLPGVGRLMAAVPPTRGVVRSILRQLGSGPALDDGRFSTAMVDCFLSLLRDTPTMRNELRAPRELWPTGRRAAVLLPPSLLGRVTTPIRFLWGADDPLGGAEVAREFVAALPHAELEMWADSGHVPWIDHADRAAVAVAEFLGT